MIYLIAYIRFILMYGIEISRILRISSRSERQGVMVSASQDNRLLPRVHMYTCAYYYAGMPGRDISHAFHALYTIFEP